MVKYPLSYVIDVFFLTKIKGINTNVPLYKNVEQNHAMIRFKVIERYFYEKITEKEFYYEKFICYFKDIEY
jgi:hypothetical protein